MQKKNILGIIAGILGLVALVMGLIAVVASIVSVVANAPAYGLYSYYGVADYLRAIVGQIINAGILASAACALIGIGGFAENRMISGVAGGLFALLNLILAINVASKLGLYGDFSTIAIFFRGLVAFDILLVIAGVLICVGSFLKANNVSGILGIVAGGLAFVGLIVYVISTVRGYMFGFGTLVAIVRGLAIAGTFVLLGLAMMKPSTATAAAAPAAAAPAPAVHPDPNWQEVPAPNQPAPATDFNPATELKRYQDLLMSGAISSEEYEQHRARIMGN